jgi:release factor glutamine methyltransferase
MHPVYEPQEDSDMLAKVVKKYASGRVLDMGTGSGVQAAVASKCKKVTSVIGVDINPAAIVHSKKKHRGSGVTWKQSDLFENVSGKYDTITFNPPYLPQEGMQIHLDLEGGKHGYEVILRFIEQVGSHLKDDGQILLLFSSQSEPAVIEAALRREQFMWEIVSEDSFFFEKLYVYRIGRSVVWRELRKKRVTNITYFSEGKRGYIYCAKYRGKRVAVKVQKPTSGALGRITWEAQALQKANALGIGPSFLFGGEDYLVYEFQTGKLLRYWIEGANGSRIRTVLRSIMKQCYALDCAGLTKEEMHHPHKNIIIGRKAVFLDFERMRHTLDPKNVSQFCQYLMRQSEFLKTKGIVVDKKEIIELSKKYQRKKTKIGFDALVAILR